MKQLKCEVCGGTDLVKQDGLFVCQYCGCKYSVEEAKKMMIEGAVDVSGSTIKIDTSTELANLYQIARRAKENNNSENAAKYYDMILVKDPNSWEAAFYVVYFQAMQCKIAQIQSAGISVANCINTVMQLIENNVEDKEEQKKAYTEVSTNVMVISQMLFRAAKNHYNGIDAQIRDKYIQEWIDNAFAAMDCVYILGDCLDLYFSFDSDANKLSILAWSQGVAWHKQLIANLENKEKNRETINAYVSKIKKYDESYTEPQESGCYVATAIYGAYDCPQVWTLRRYRDYTLAATWYGRAFIHTYYTISPALVKQFGHIKWFRLICKRKLDHIVAKLQANGVESTPYEDKIW